MFSGSVSASASSTVSTSEIDSGASPIVPTTSSWPPWPISTTAHPIGRIPSRLYVHLRDERTGRVDRRLVASRGAVVDDGCHPVRREDDDRPVRCVRLILDEDRAPPLEVADDVGVVDDLLAHVHGCAVEGKRSLHRLDGAFDSRTVTPGRGKQNPLNQTVGHGSTVPAGPPGDAALKEEARRSGGSVATGLLLVLTADCKARNAPRFASPSANEANESYLRFQ